MSEKRAFSRLIKNVRARFLGYKNFVLDKVTEWQYIKYVNSSLTLNQAGSQ